MNLVTRDGRKPYVKNMVVMREFRLMDALILIQMLPNIFKGRIRDRDRRPSSLMATGLRRLAEAMRQSADDLDRLI